MSWKKLCIRKESVVLTKRAISSISECMLQMKIRKPITKNSGMLKILKKKYLIDAKYKKIFEEIQCGNNFACIGSGSSEHAKFLQKEAAICTAKIILDSCNSCKIILTLDTKCSRRRKRKTVVSTKTQEFFKPDSPGQESGPL